MEETYGLKTIILFSQPFREYDSKVTLFSLEKGKLDLVARGTKRIKSKLASHLEPGNLVEIMAIKGKNYDYVGSAVSENCFANIKENFAKLQTTAKAINLFTKTIKAGEAEKNIFFLLTDFFKTLNQQELIAEEKLELLLAIFSYKFLVYSGYKPELNNCLICGKKIKPEENFVDVAKGGLICSECLNKNYSGTKKAISADCIKILRLTENTYLDKIIKIKIEQKLNNEICCVTSSFLNYHLNK